MIAFVAFGVVVLYVVGINVLLKTRLLGNVLSSDPETLLVEYRTAYSIVPWRVHVEDLAIRGRDTHVEWKLLIDRADFRPDFGALLHRRFQAGHVRADGVSMRVRQRVPGITPAEMAALPTIPGFPDPPLADIGPPAPPLTDANYNLWSVQLEDVVVTHAREIWFDEVRASGEMNVRGRWFFRPIRRLEVFADVELVDVAVGHGELARWGSGITGGLRYAMGPFDLRATEPMTDQVSVVGDASGVFLAEALLTPALAERGFAAHSGDAPVEVHVDLAHGVLRPGTRARMDALPFDLRAAALGLEVAGVAATFAVDEGGTGHARLAGTDLRIAYGADLRALAHRIDVATTSRKLDLAEPFTDVSEHVFVDVPELTVPALVPLAHSIGLPEGLTLERGSARVTTHLELNAKKRVASGAVQLHGRDLRLRVGSDVFEGSLKVSLAAKAKEDEDETDLSGSVIDFEDGDVPETTRWWAHVALSHAALRAVGRPHFDGRVVARMKDAAPLAAVIASTSGAPKWALDAISTKGFVANGQLLVSGDTLEARSVTARGEDVELGFAFAKVGGSKQWAALVNSGPLRFGIGGVGGKTDVLLFGAETWFASRSASIRAAASHDE